LNDKHFRNLKIKLTVPFNQQQSVSFSSFYFCVRPPLRFANTLWRVAKFPFYILLVSVAQTTNFRSVLVAAALLIRLRLGVLITPGSLIQYVPEHHGYLHRAVRDVRERCASLKIHTPCTPSTIIPVCLPTSSDKKEVPARSSRRFDASFTLANFS